MEWLEGQTVGCGHVACKEWKADTLLSPRRSIEETTWVTMLHLAKEYYQQSDLVLTFKYETRDAQNQTF